MIGRYVIGMQLMYCGGSVNLERNGDVIRIPGKELTLLDKLVLDFIKFLGSDYVIVSGYIAILFGRSRNTEDIDIYIKNEGLEAFEKFYSSVMSDGRYWALNAEDAKDAYELMTIDKSSLRFAENGTAEPNFEIKFAAKETDFYSLNNALVVDFGKDGRLRISPIELQIAYKLYLGSDKDIADATHLFITFREMLDMEKLKAFLKALNIGQNAALKLLGDHGV